MYHFHWLPDSAEWKVSIPRQDNTSTSIAYQGGYQANIALDLHSHHGMDAFFSETDNEDEQDLRFYAVIGNIYTKPTLRLRVGVYGDWMALNPLILFEGLGPFRVGDTL